MDKSSHCIEICGIAFEDILVGVGIRFACLLVLEGFCPEVEMPLEHLAKSFNVCVHIVTTRRPGTGDRSVSRKAIMCSIFRDINLSPVLPQPVL